MAKHYTYEEIKSKCDDAGWNETSDVQLELREYDPAKERLIAGFCVEKDGTPTAELIAGGRKEIAEWTMGNGLVTSFKIGTNTKTDKLFVVVFPENYPIEEAHKFCGLCAWLVYGFIHAGSFDSGMAIAVSLDDFNEFIVKTDTTRLFLSNLELIDQLGRKALARMQAA